MENKNEKNEKLGVGASAGIGAGVGIAAGVVAGTMLPHEAKGEETENNVETQQTHTTTAGTHHTSGTHHAQDSTQPAHEQPAGETNGQQPVTIINNVTVNNVQPEPITDPDPLIPDPDPLIPDPDPLIPDPDPIDPANVEIIGYSTVNVGNDELVDVAVLNVNGQEVYVTDVDRDGIADAMAADFNHNEMLDDNEIIDISGQNIAMQDFKDEYEMNQGFVTEEQPHTTPSGDDMPGNSDWAYEADGGSDYINDANVDDYMA